MTREKAQKRLTTPGASSTSSSGTWPTRVSIPCSVSGDPARPAAALLKALGITPSPSGSKKVTRRVSDELAQLREAFEAGHSG